MSRSISRPFYHLVMCLILTQIYSPLIAQSAISDMPPLLKSNVPPNIVFTLDDSGSMQWESVPDAMVTGYGYSGFPLPDNIYKSGSVAYNKVMGFGNELSVAQYRSSAKNSLYYNPAIRYYPWIDSSGIAMANADPIAAKFNPVLPTGVASLPVINLTSPTQKAAGGCTPWATSSYVLGAQDSVGCSGSEKRRDFYPATYFIYDPTLASACTTSNVACFKRIEIRLGSEASFPPPTLARTDCVQADGKTPATSCTLGQEIQNFANWFQYWRSRILVARGGVGTAFAKQGTAIRVGYGAINETGTTVSTGTMVAGVSNDFSGSNRSKFFDYLYTHPMPASGTPLRLAVDQVGQYFMTKTGVTGPWQNTIGDSASGQATCRQNYHILMTDGYWNGGAAASTRRLDYDSRSGAVMTRPDGTTWQYIKAHPYYDDAVVTGSPSGGGTLADIAMYYWVTDLRADWTQKEKKNVPTSADDPAFWQHLVHFTVGLGVKGSLDPKTDLPALTSGTKTWPLPADDSANNVDDLFHAAVNSRGEFFSAASPTEFANALDSALNKIAARSGSAAAVGTSSKSVGSGVKLYTSTYETTNWSGTLEQKTIDPDTGAITGSDWNSDSKIPSDTTRKIFTSNATGTGGVSFEYASLAAGDQAIFDTAAAATATYPFSLSVTGEKMVNYIRGDQVNTRASATDVSKAFRVRAKLLGDLVNSDPLYVKEGVDGSYSFLPSGVPGKDSYLKFLGDKKSREPLVYVGSNDGMLHAFNMSTVGPTSGLERFAFVPKAVIPNLPFLADPAYTHKFYVDGSPQIGDAFIGGAWKTILLGSTGAGGKSIFALDVTNISDTTPFTAANVLWERNVNTHGATAASPDANLGFTIGNPQMGRMKDGRWVAIYGDGYESTSYKATLYVVDLATGDLIANIDTGVGSSSAKNGLSTPKLLIGSDATIKAAYAGDLQGNLWKFDFSSPVTGSIVPKLAFGSTPFFQASAQPITTQPQIYRHPKGGYLVMFGTGKIFENTDAITKDTQTLYGVWDRSDMPVTTPLVVADAIVGGKSKLQQQIYIASSGFYKIQDEQTIDWSTKRGWYIDLNMTAGERVITDPLVIDDFVLFTTLIPGASSDPCIFDGLSTLMYISPFNGGALGYKTIDTNGDGKITSADALVSGKQISATFGNTVLRTGNGRGVSYTAPGKGKTDCTSGVCIGSETVGLRDPAPTVRLWQQILNRQ